jgi:hypothetical protein
LPFNKWIDLAYRVNFLAMPFIYSCALATPAPSEGEVSAPLLVFYAMALLHFVLSFVIVFIEDKATDALKLAIATLLLCASIALPILLLAAIPAILWIYPLNAASLLRTFLSGGARRVLGCGQHGGNVELPSVCVSRVKVVAAATCITLLACICLAVGAYQDMTRTMVSTQAD